MKNTAEKYISVHSNGQITLGKRFAGEMFEMTILPSGQILLTPGSFRPKHHETFFTPEADEQMQEFKEWLKTKKSAAPEQDALETLKGVAVGKK